MADTPQDEADKKPLSFRNKEGIGTGFNLLATLFAEQKADVTLPSSMGAAKCGKKV